MSYNQAPYKKGVYEGAFLMFIVGFTNKVIEDGRMDRNIDMSALLLIGSWKNSTWNTITIQETI